MMNTSNKDRIRITITIIFPYCNIPIPVSIGEPIYFSPLTAFGDQTLSE